MKPIGAFRFASAILAFLGILWSDSRALVRLNDGKDQIFLTLKAAVGWDSNIFASANGTGDTLWNTTATAEYTRRAGIIGIDASVGLDIGIFDKFSTEDYVNPRMSMEFTKGSGRTTGSMAFNATRESRPDVAANIRAESWNYNASAKARYRVIERYSIAGSLTYDQRDFLDNPLLVDLTTYTASSDLYYSYRSNRDFFAGYRLRVSDSSRDTFFYDHALTAGISGSITPKLNGTFRIGYQLRNENGLPRDENHSGVTAAFSSTWSIGARASLTGQLAKDFATTSTNISNDSFAATLDGKISLTKKFSATAGIGYGRLDFLGIFGAGRNDTYMTLSAGITRTLNKYLNAMLGYSYLSNWSTLTVADYDRHAITLSLSSRF